MSTFVAVCLVLLGFITVVTIVYLMVEPVKRIRHVHRWFSTDTGIRACSICGRRECLWLRRFPRPGEPQSFWSDSPAQLHDDLIEQFDRYKK